MLPVLMYHNIAAVPTKGSSSYKGLFVSPSMFAQQMKYLHDNGYTTITPSQFYTYLKAGKTPNDKLVLITFDDGSEGQYKYAYPVLKQYHMTATFYIIADRSPINKKQLKEISDNGMVIESHSSTHPDLSKIKNTKTLIYEILTSKNTLQKITGKTIVSIAYPGVRIIRLLKIWLSLMVMNWVSPVVQAYTIAINTDMHYQGYIYLVI